MAKRRSRMTPGQKSALTRKANRILSAHALPVRTRRELTRAPVTGGTIIRGPITPGRQRSKVTRYRDTIGIAQYVLDMILAALGAAPSRLDENIEEDRSSVTAVTAPIQITEPDFSDLESALALAPPGYYVAARFEIDGQWYSVLPLTDISRPDAIAQALSRDLYTVANIYAEASLRGRAPAPFEMPEVSIGTLTGVSVYAKEIE